MIAIQKIGKSFIGALRYNLKKMDAHDPARRAELLDTNFSDIRLTAIKAEVDLLRQLRPNLNRYTYHTSLNFSVDDADRLDSGTLTAIAHEYLEAMGFNSNQYLIFRHHDAGHPHLHLLVNRICFDGSIVSDSNNYVKSESAIRVIEERYNLISVEPSNKAAMRAPTKNEVEMAVRKHKASDKIVLQMILQDLLYKNLTLQELLVKGEQAGVHFLFNQASTGRVSGVTYFFKDFKAKGQSLGNRYKWSELVKAVDYDQERDKHAIIEANKRTTELYNLVSKDQQSHITEFEAIYCSDDTLILESDERVTAKANESVNSTPLISVGISDDIDDEAVLGKNRRKWGKAGRGGR